MTINGACTITMIVNDNLLRTMQELRLLIADSIGKGNIMLEHQLRSSSHRVIMSKASTQHAVLREYQRSQPDLALISLQLKGNKPAEQFIQNIRKKLNPSTCFYLVFGPVGIGRLILNEDPGAESRGIISGEIPVAEDQRWLQSFEDYVQQHLPYLAVSDLAHTFAMSESTLLRQVKRLTGYAPARYIQEMRLNRGRQLLESGAFSSITQIANTVGYRDPRAFARNYKKRYGILPSEVLRKNEDQHHDP